MKKERIVIGDIYKVTKFEPQVDPQITIKNYGIDALLFGEVMGYAPKSVSQPIIRYELYKVQVPLIKITDETDLIAQFIEISEIKKNKIIVCNSSLLTTIPFGLNSLFVDEKSIKPYFEESIKDKRISVKISKEVAKERQKIKSLVLSLNRNNTSK